MDRASLEKMGFTVTELNHGKGVEKRGTGNPLLDAIGRDDVVAMKKVLDWVTRVNAWYSQKNNADFLYEFVDDNLVKCMDAIFEKCTVPMQGEFATRSRDGDFNTTPFLYAIALGRIDVVEVFLKHANKTNLQAFNYKHAWLTEEDIRNRGYEIDNQDYSVPGWMTDYDPLTQAVNYFHTDILGLMLKSKLFDVNAKGLAAFRTVTPLFMALHPMKKQSQYESVKLLMGEPSLDINFVDYFGDTALHLAAENQYDVKVVKLLLKSNSDLTIRNREDKTAIDLANFAVKKVLLKYVVSEQQRDKNKKLVAEAKRKEEETKQEMAAAKAKEKEVEEPKIGTKFNVGLSGATSNLSAKENPKPCAVCQDESVQMVLQPCNHLALCGDCGEEARRQKKFSCPRCQQRVGRFMKIYY